MTSLYDILQNHVDFDKESLESVLKRVTVQLTQESEIQRGGYGSTEEKIAAKAIISLDGEEIECFEEFHFIQK